MSLNIYISLKTNRKECRFKLPVFFGFSREIGLLVLKVWSGKCHISLDAVMKLRANSFFLQQNQSFFLICYWIVEKSTCLPFTCLPVYFQCFLLFTSPASSKFLFYDFPGCTVKSTDQIHKSHNPITR